METPPNSEENLYELSRERKAFRKALKDKSAPEKIADMALEGIQETKDRLSASGFNIQKEGGLKKAQERFKKDKERAEMAAGIWIDEKAIAESMGEEAGAFQEVSTLSKKLDDARDFEMRQSFATKGDHPARKANERLLEAAREEREKAEAELLALHKEHPKASRAYDLTQDAEGLHKEGHIAPVASVRENRRRIGRNMLLGKPMFLHGPTGTGKTSQARSAAEHFTGKPAEMVYCNPQTRESAVWGKTGIRPAKGGAIETVDIFGPLAKAANEGTAVIFDEFTALQKEQMVFIKGIFNAKPGDTITVVGNGRIKITPGFQMIFTANLKSEKNPERQDLPPEIAREFEQNNIKINYVSKDEAYDIMLARLMNPDCSVDASWMTINETMPKLCEAMEEIQIAYTGAMRPETARLLGGMDASGKTPGLKKFVMTQGTIEAMLEDWDVEKKQGGKMSFAEHIDQRLKIGLTFEEYPLADRILAAKILASKGFLRTLTPQELGLQSDVFNFDAAKKLRGDKKAIAELARESGDEKHISLATLADLDPFNVRTTSAKEKAERMVRAGSGKNREVVAGETSVEDAERLMRGRFIGVESIEKTFGFVPENVPPIPFSRETIELHEKLGHYLIYEANATPEGMPLTMEEMAKRAGDNIIEKNPDGSPSAYRLFKDQFGSNGDILPAAWFSDKTKYKTILDETPDGGWKFVSPEIIPGSTDKNYIDQTDFLVAFWKEQIFENDETKIPQEYADAFTKWETDKAKIRKLIAGAHWIEACDALMQEPVSNLIRESFASTMYRLIILHKAEDKKILQSAYSWSKTPSSAGYLLCFGYFGAGGASVRWRRPARAWTDFGSVFSRMK